MGDIQLQVPQGQGGNGNNKRDRRLSTGSAVSEYVEENQEVLEKSRTLAKKKYEKEKYKNPGPIAKRRCQDLCCGFLFIQYWIVMFIIAYYALTKGNPNYLLYGVDSDGNLCGQNGTNRDLSAKPYLFYFDITSPSSGVSVCVSQCPNITWAAAATSIATFLSSPQDAICTYDTPQPTNNATLQEAVANGTCASFYFISTSVLYRCVPDASAYNATSSAISSIAAAQESIINSINARSVSLVVQRDLLTSWKPILISVAISVVLSLSWLIFLQLCAGVMVYTTIFVFVLSTAASMLYLWYRYVQLTTGQSIIQIDELLKTTVLESYQYSTNTYLICAIVITVFSVLMYLALIFLRKRIVMAVTVIKISSRAVRAVPLIVFVPVLKALMLALVAAWFIFIMVYLATSGSITQVSVGVYTFSSDYTLQYLQLYYIFGFFWTWNLVIAMGDCTMAGVFGAWYWTKDKKKLPTFLIIPAIYRTFRYHLGSLAFGSLIIALIQFIRYLLYKLEKKLKGQSKILTTILKVMQCCFLCFERFLKFLNKNAYIEIAVYGYSFCKAAKWAFQLITRNIIRIVVVTKLGDFLMFLGKVLITFLTGIFGNILIEYYSTQPSYWIVPMAVICFNGYGIAYLFMAVVEMAVSTIFLCFCEDLERNDGSPERPYYMDPSLQKYVDKEARDAKPIDS